VVLTTGIRRPVGLSRTRSWLALAALALGGFGIGTTEFVAMGLLPELARDLLPELYVSSPDAAIGQGGWLIAAYALGVVVGAPTIAVFSARFPRKKLLVALLIAFTLGTVLSAVLPSFELVLAARFIAGLPHGAYFGIASLMAASLLGPGKRGTGVSIVLSGLTIATVVGVPVITFIGQVSSWRISYLVVAGIFAFTLIAVSITVPPQPGDSTATVRRELAAFGTLQVWLAMLIGALGFSGLFAVYTYIAPVVTGVTKLDAALVPIVLVVVGLGMTLGNLIGGRAADRNVEVTIFLSFAVFAASLAAFGLTAHTTVGLLVSVFVVGAAVSALSPAIQTRLMDVAGESQTLAAAANHAALNVGNSLGAFLGGVAIAAGFGYLSPAWIGLALCVPAVLIAVASFCLERRTSRQRAAGQSDTSALGEARVLL
jgi:DHA1 family inner membrane transport protein